MDRLTRLREAKNVGEVASVLLPGSSEAMRQLRSSALSLSADRLARGVLLVGPAGSGKSTLARTIGLCRYLHLLRPSALTRVLRSIRLDEWGRLSTETMDWYREISLTGLVDTLADTQLFGIARKVASEVEARDGVFRLAMNGLPSTEDATLAARATGGVVFLDELAELPVPLQPKLLTVLSGGMVYPVGREGATSEGFTFRGLTIAATWRELTTVRPDLLARLSDHVVRLPSLNERTEDLRELVEMITDGLLGTLTAEAKRLQAPGFADIDPSALAEPEPRLVSDEDYAALAAADWTELGDVRGLTQVIRIALAFRTTVTEGLRIHQRSRVAVGAQSAVAEQIVERLLNDARDGDTLTQLIGRAEQQLRHEVVEYLRANDGELQRVMRRLQIPRDRALQQLRDLRRDRSRSPSE